MTSPSNGSFSPKSLEATRIARVVLERTGLHGAELEKAIEKSLTVFTRLQAHQNDFLATGASFKESTALALERDLIFVENGCGNPSCPTDRGDLLTQAKTYRCARCHITLYCGKDCQRAHWSVHKLSCRPTEPDAKK